MPRLGGEKKKCRVDLGKRRGEKAADCQGEKKRVSEVVTRRERGVESMRARTDGVLEREKRMKQTNRDLFEKKRKVPSRNRWGHRRREGGKEAHLCMKGGKRGRGRTHPIY